MRPSKHGLLYILVAGSLVLVAGCASTGPKRIEKHETKIPKGEYYEVKKGDTLWRVSKLYDARVEDIVKANKLPDPTKITVGQKLFIPKIYDNDPLENSGTINIKTRQASDFIWPVLGRVISQFGAKKGLVANKGIDIEASEGSDVMAADKGLVNFIDENMKGFGKTIIIDHQNGYSSIYAHNSAIMVKTGEEVSKSQAIAKVGKTGRASGPFLHFEIRKGAEPQNPLSYLP